MEQGTKGFGNSCKAKDIYLSKKSLERKVSKSYDLQTKFLLYPKNHMFKSTFFVTVSRQNIGFWDEVYQWGVYQWYLIFWIWGVISKLEHFWHLTYYSQSWSRKSGLCENCIPTSSSFRLPYALLALAKIGKVSETEFHGPNSWRWLRWKRRSWWRDSKSRWWKKVDWCDRTTALSWFLLAELSSWSCPLLLLPIAVQNTNTVEYKYKYSRIRTLMQIRGSFWQSCHRKQVLASPPLLFAPIEEHNTPESLLLSFCKSCPSKILFLKVMISIVQRRKNPKLSG